ncbi:MAG TPA: hypothetical protein VM510_08400 [Caulifigura sp.]|nr:hypothetical protein [Caulifigura sp.]
MDIPELTPQRRKMLMGVAAASLLAALGFSFAPDLELANKQATKDVDDVLALVDDERAIPVSEKTTARALRRARLSAVHESTATSSPDPTVEQPRAIVETPARAIADSPPATGSQVIPASYKERLALLAEEEERLLKQQRGPQNSAAAAAPVPTVSQASIETSDDANNGVEHALAQSRRPGRMRRVEQIFGEAETSTARSGGTGRGAWLSGKIEIE